MPKFITLIKDQYMEKEACRFNINYIKRWKSYPAVHHNMPTDDVTPIKSWHVKVIAVVVDMGSGKEEEFKTDYFEYQSKEFHEQLSFLNKCC